MLVGGQTSATIPAPASIRSPEERRLPATATPVRTRSPEVMAHTTCSPAGTGFAGAGACSMFPPPASVGPLEDSLSPHAQLRLAFARRRKTITGNRYSGESPFTGDTGASTCSPAGTGFAGAGPRTMLPPPTRSLSSATIPAAANIRSSEERQLPATPTPVSDPFTGGNGASTCSPAGTGFAGAGARSLFPPPTRACSSEDSLGARAQLRPAFARRSKDDYRQPLLR